MPQYSITAVRGPNPWDGKHGTMHGFVLSLEGEDKPVHINQKPETPAPTVGQTLDLILSPHHSFDDALKGTKQQAAGGFGGGGGPRPEDPKRSARIVRQHSQSLAMAYIEQKIKLGKITEDFSLDDVFKLADKFDADVDAAGSRAA